MKFCLPTRLLCLVFCLVSWAVDGAPTGAAISYQGRLVESGSPANGRFDLQFTLFTTAAGGSPAAGVLTLPDVTVSNGLFTVAIDFGASVFSGANLWIEIGMKPVGSAGDFITLVPRQSLAPAPYAIHTLKAQTLIGPLPDAQLSTNIARLDSDQIFGGAVRASSFSGDGAGLSNVVAGALSTAQMQRLWRIPIPFVAVTNAGNAADVTDKGAVAYNFRIGKYEVNNHQYAAFLNAVATEDTHRLYSTNMSFDVHGGIDRSGSPGEFFYTVKPGMGHRPVVWVDFYDVLRFCNWLHNGQPSGEQDGTTTEDGAYSLTTEALAQENVLRNPGARFWLPSDDEWYKAAHHQPVDAGGDVTDYWLYPTRSNDAPFSEPPPGGVNSANSCCETGLMATDVGSYRQAISYYGTYDQAGNVQEWTEWTSEFSFLRNRRIRGGSWYYNEFYSKSTDFEFDTTDYDSDSIGFRVAGRLE